jgi:hypothetical protein
LRASDRKLFVFTYGRGVWTATLNDNISTSVNNVTAGTGFNIYPNPATSFAQIKGYVGGEVQVINANGSVVPVSVTVTGKLDVRALTSGLYFVKYKNGGLESVARLLID